MLSTILLYTFLGVASIQLIYYFSFSVFAFAKYKQRSNANLPISVVICAKNEANNLTINLPYILEQNYKNFEIVLINDASVDDTLSVMESFQKNNQNIRIVDVKPNENFWGNKKYALTLGIKAAKHEHLLFTDADCVPANKNWIQEMANQFDLKKSFVLGYGKYQFNNFSLLNLLVCYETLLTAIQYFSYTLLGNPYMGVGRNLAYQKDEFFKIKGFINHIQIRSGDDDLFVQEASNKHNTAISFHPDSFTLSHPPNKIRDWFRQKRRHISTAQHYKTYHKLLLGLFFISKFFFWILLPLSFVINPYTIPLISLGLYLMITYLIVGFSASKLKENHVLWLLPFLDIFLVFSQFAIFIANLIHKPTHWK